MATYNRKDSYYKKAKKAGYKSRAAYKLKEINDKYKILKKGYKVLDCGAAPGGWSQVALELVGDKGLVVAVDRLQINNINNQNFKFIHGDFEDNSTRKEVSNISPVYDIIISDIAPNTTGIRDVDHNNSLNLVELVYNFAMEVLTQNGTFLFKLFEGQGRKALIEKLKKDFKEVKTIKAEATRPGSVEIYVLCVGKIGG